MRPLHQLPRLSRLALFLTAAGCTDKVDLDTTACTHEAQLIGRTICGSNGYLLALASPRDTVITYNLPAELAALTTQASYQTGRGLPLFTSASFVRLKLGYSRLDPAQQTAVFCTANGWLAPFNQLTHSGREIRVLCASQLP